jgi:hypothetical protein
MRRRGGGLFGCRHWSPIGWYWTLFLVKLDAVFASSGLRLNRIAPTECPICVIEAVSGQV